ncbi:MAG: hypothetical protein J0L88_01650 [Xanthomonadales bacterium]|nr:hypothetical protein [Xanthomonadales bacterium]
MRRWIGVLALLAVDVQAQSALLGKRLIARGDAIERVREAGGEPDRIDRIDAGGGSPPMQIWTYDRRGRRLTVWIVAERVVRVDETTREHRVRGDR